MECLDKPELVNLQGDFFGQENRNVLQILAVKCLWKNGCKSDKTPEQIDSWLSLRRIMIAFNDMTYEPEVYDSDEIVKKRLRTNSYLVDQNKMSFVQNQLQK